MMPPVILPLFLLEVDYTSIVHNADRYALEPAAIATQDLDNGSVIMFVKPGRSYQLTGSFGGINTPGVTVNVFVPCVADWDRSGEVDKADAVRFLGDWEDGITRTDLDRNGIIDGNDIVTFKQLAEFGCYQPPEEDEDGDE